MLHSAKRIGRKCCRVGTSSRGASGRAVWMARRSSDWMTASIRCTSWHQRDGGRPCGVAWGTHLPIGTAHSEMQTLRSADLGRRQRQDILVYGIRYSSLFFSHLPLACLASSLHCMKEMGRAAHDAGALLKGTVLKMSEVVRNHGPFLNYINTSFKLSKSFLIFFLDSHFSSQHLLI